jgi:hypothetical protein
MEIAHIDPKMAAKQLNKMYNKNIPFLSASSGNARLIVNKEENPVYPLNAPFSEKDFP